MKTVCIEATVPYSTEYSLYDICSFTVLLRNSSHIQSFPYMTRLKACNNSLSHFRWHNSRQHATGSENGIEILSRSHISKQSSVSVVGLTCRKRYTNLTNEVFSSYLNSSVLHQEVSADAKIGSQDIKVKMHLVFQAAS